MTIAFAPINIQKQRFAFLAIYSKNNKKSIALLNKKQSSNNQEKRYKFY